jgi:hypothetical protein
MRHANPTPAKWVKEAFEEVGVIEGGLDERNMFESNPYRQLMEERAAG